MAQPDHLFDLLRGAAGNVSRETFDRLTAFEARFRQWNARINLVSASTLDEFWVRHVIDSAQLLKIAPEGAQQWLDLGSGGGFPGLILAFLIPQGSRIAMVESNRKKAAFLSAIAGEFHLPADVHAIRIEDAPQRIRRADIVTARALAGLPLLLQLAAPWLQDGATGLFHKGRDYRKEIDESTRLWRFDLLEHGSKTDPESVVLEIRNLQQVPEIAES